MSHGHLSAMSFFDFFRPRPKSFIDHVHQILRRGAELNEGEQECVNQLMRLSLLKPGDWISPKLRNNFIVIGLYCYKEEEWQRALELVNMFEALANQRIQNIICAMAKAYFILPIPIFLYHIGEYLGLLNHPSAEGLLARFLDEQRKFQPDQIMALFLSEMPCDIPAAIARAEKIVSRASD